MAPSLGLHEAIMPAPISQLMALSCWLHPKVFFFSPLGVGDGGTSSTPLHSGEGKWLGQRVHILESSK